MCIWKSGLKIILTVNLRQSISALNFLQILYSAHSQTEKPQVMLLKL